MQKVIKEYNLYTIYELKELFPEAYEKAIEDQKGFWSQDGLTRECDDFIKSIEAIMDSLECSILNWEICLYAPSRIDIITEDYMELTNKERNELIIEFRNMIEKEVQGQCSFTGNYTDCYFFDGLKQFGELTYNNFHKAIEHAAKVAVYKFQGDLESMYEDDERHAEDMGVNEYMFDEYGKMEVA